MIQQFAQTAANEIFWQPDAFKALAAAIALGAAAMGLGMIGSSYMKAIGRNPEAGKAAGQIVIIAAMVEVTALLAFLVFAFFV